MGMEAEDVLEAAGGSKSTSILSNFISGQKTAEGAHVRFADVSDSPDGLMWLLAWHGRGEILKKHHLYLGTLGVCQKC